MGAILLSAVISSGIYALISLGFALAFRISGVFNLAHGILLIAAAYANYSLQSSLQVAPWLAIPIALFIVTAIGATIEAWLIPLAKTHGFGRVDLLILSWLVLVIGQDAISVTFSNRSIYLGPSHIEQGWLILDTRITSLQVLIICISMTVAAGLYLFLTFSIAGREVRAVGDNARLAAICGVNVRRVLIGILLSHQERLDPLLGLRFSMIGIVCTLAGLRLGPAGAIVGALVLAFLESIVLYVVNPELRNATVYFGLLVLLLVAYRHRDLPSQG
jgi:branched-subunit amino acid ABC-type transport system permease component